MIRLPIEHKSCNMMFVELCDLYVRAAHERLLIWVGSAGCGLLLAGTLRELVATHLQLAVLGVEEDLQHLINQLASPSSSSAKAKSSEWRAASIPTGPLMITGLKPSRAGR